MSKYNNLKNKNISNTGCFQEIIELIKLDVLLYLSFLYASSIIDLQFIRPLKFKKKKLLPYTFSEVVNLIYWSNLGSQNLII